MTIRLLSPTLVSRIAAGEVIERPASAIKELVENAIDAGATEITVTISEAGVRRIHVQDNGRGMGPEDLSLAVERHATSKLNGEDLLNISYLGFRGEALPSIGAVSRLTITSREQGAETAWKLHVNAGLKEELQPVAAPYGTLVEIDDLFYATPARLKFLKSPATETSNSVDMVERLAMANPHVSFRLFSEKRRLIDIAAGQGDLFESRLKRFADLIGRDFSANAICLDEMREETRVSGYIGLPTYHKPNSQYQYFFVNQRPVRDRLLLGAMRGAYQDVLAHDRYPVVAIFIDLPAEDVDVNVHPTKAEVRFRDGATVRNLVVGSVKRALAAAGHRSSTTVTQAALSSFSSPMGSSRLSLSQAHLFQRAEQRPWVGDGSAALAETRETHFSEAGNQAAYGGALSPPVVQPSSQLEEAATARNDYPLGLAKAQVHGTYIVAQNAKGVVIVDQHAAHERLVYEQLKKELAHGIKRETLLIPEVIELSVKGITLLSDHLDAFAHYGLVMEPFGDQALLVREVPSLLKSIPIQPLVHQLAADIEAQGSSARIEEQVLARYSTFACHHSIRAGRTLTHPEMDALLRQMEETPLSGQCNHGRPTHVLLSLEDIERLFGRK